MVLQLQLQAQADFLGHSATGMTFQGLKNCRLIRLNIGKNLNFTNDKQLAPPLHGYLIENEHVIYHFHPRTCQNKID